jgi:hypothetical protein
MTWLTFSIAAAAYVLAALPGIWVVSGILRLSPLPREVRHQIETHLPLSSWIGVMERWLVIYLIGRGEWSALGFVIAAKGLLRIPDIRSSFSGREGDPGLSHILSSYILLGTLISLTLAVLLAELSAWLRCLTCC